MTRAPIVVPAALAAVLVLVASHAWAGAPTDQLKQYMEQVIKVLDDPALQSEAKKSERRAAVRKVAIEIFDVGETARRALGRHWKDRTPAEQKEFVDLFADLLERTYIARIDLYGGERIRFTSEQIDGDNAIVRGRIISRRGTEIPVEGRMLKRGDRWLMYDILVENVSLIGNYRAQFDQIIQKSSYDDLVRRLKDRRGFAEAGPAKPTERPR